MKTREHGVNEDRVISDVAFLAANVKMPSGDRLIDKIVAYSTAVREAKKARWTPPMIAVLEDDLIAVLAQFYRRADWYREPLRKPFPRV